MEFELARHEWSTLGSPYSDAALLPDAVRELCTTSDRAAAELAARRITWVLPTNEKLSQASVAAASALVHGLWRVDEEVLDLVLGLLADIAAGFEEDEPPLGGFSELHAQCMREISLGFSAYVEILETSSNMKARTACIDLVTACGLAATHLTDRAISALELACDLPDLADCNAVLSNSLSDLREQS